MAIQPARMFVYGTLTPGHLRWPFLEPFAVAHRAASVPGRLYDSSCGWPVATFEAGPALVPGTLVELEADRLAEALARLDEVEAAATDLLTRVQVTTTDGVDAWAYGAAGPVSAMSAIDRWMGRNER